MREKELTICFQEIILDKRIKIRLKKIRKSIKEKNIDTLMVLVEENRRYLSGFTGEDTQFDESAGAVFITQDKLILATDSRYELQAKHESPLYEVLCYKKGLIKELPSILTILKAEKLGFESIRMSYMWHKKIIEQLISEKIDITLVETENIVENLRIKKDEQEIELTKKAVDIAESAFMETAKEIAVGMTEKEAAWDLEKRLREKGADSLSFPVICASGPNSALPHAIPCDRKFKKNEPVLFDWGVKLNGYCSDISRTLIIGGPDETFKKVFKTVIEAQQKAIKAIKPGISSKSIDKIARDYIEENGFKGKFRHGTGHGTGLAVHEQPSISPLKETTLEPGMLFTVEPGIYIPGWGGVRIENQVVVKENGVQVLNSLEPSFSI